MEEPSVIEKYFWGFTCFYKDMSTQANTMGQHNGEGLSKGLALNNTAYSLLSYGFNLLLWLGAYNQVIYADSKTLPFTKLFHPLPSLCSVSGQSHLGATYLFLMLINDGALHLLFLSHLILVSIFSLERFQHPDPPLNIFQNTPGHHNLKDANLIPRLGGVHVHVHPLSPPFCLSTNVFPVHNSLSQRLERTAVLGNRHHKQKKIYS
ncbi:hypothetical protein J6590_059179 [Homalodisca vitripennis]|nr:hypothetical protein J6590_059179 [Homalodisca vitripennis]